MLLHDGQGWRPFNQLSDGQRRIAAIFCDLALRCASLNSQLGETCISDTPGIVTIDELDLHLHPSWQRSVVGDLRRVFPQIQFVVTSHSPFLLQAAFEHGQVVDMVSGKFVQPGDTSIEDIAEGVMGVDQPQRGVRFLALKRTAAEYIRLLEAPASTPEEVARIKAELDGHMAHFANDPASAAWLAQQREAAGL
jgi:predicted ATP-binding protein involved in virulence